MSSRLSRFLASFIVAVLLFAFAAPQLGTPTVQAKDGTGLDKITWSGTIRIEMQSHHTDPPSNDPYHTHTFTSNQNHATEYQVQGLPHDALNQWDNDDQQVQVRYHEDHAGTEVSTQFPSSPTNTHSEGSEDGSGSTTGSVSLWIRGDGELDQGHCRIEAGGVGSRSDGGQLTKDISTSRTEHEWGVWSGNPINDTKNTSSTTYLLGVDMDFTCAKGAHTLSGTQETEHTADMTERVTWNLYQDGDAQTEVELVPPEAYPDWMPQADKDETTVGNFIDIGIVAHTKGDPSLKPPKQVKKYTITLENTSREQGIDLNWPSSMAGAKATKDYDFRIDPKNALVKVIDDDGQQAETTEENLTDFKVRLNSYDWGGYTTLKVVAVFSDGSTVTAHIHGGTSESLNVPQDDNQNHIADVWEKNWELTGAQADADDDDRPVGDGYKGDSIPLYDEYRGFHIGGHHERLSPITKDLFVLDSTSLGGGIYQASTSVHLHLVQSSETDIIPGNAGAQDYVTANGHGEKVYAIWLLNKAIAAGVVGRTNGGPSIPENIESIWIDAAALAELDGGPDGPQLKSTVAHELGHASNVRHHGQGPDFKVGNVYCPDPNNDRAMKEYKCPDDPDHPGWELSCFMVAAKGGLYSGNDACPMRYDDTDFYLNPKGKCTTRTLTYNRLSLYGQDPPGLGSFCASPAGTGVNDPSRDPPKAGDATLGRCAGQIRLKK